MPKAKKRTRITQKRSDSPRLHIREIVESKGGHSWTTHLVQGWREGGRWQRKRFRDRAEAEAFVAVKQVELANGSLLHSVITRLSAEEVKDAEVALGRLKGRYTLDDAVSYFLAHYAEPETKVVLRDAVKGYLRSKESEGVCDRTLRQLDSTFGQFLSFADSRGIGEVHEVAPDDVTAFLKSLRGKDGINSASKQTWNNRRAELRAFFGWCSEKERRWTSGNPAEDSFRFTKKQIARGRPDTLSAKQASKLLEYVADFKGGIYIRLFALSLFAGIRSGPDGEIHKLARHPDRETLIDLKRGVIHVLPEISKTGTYRKIPIRDNLRAWLLSAPSAEIFPPGHDADIKAIRKRFKLSHDVMRHSFISHHVAAFKSVGAASLEAGNTEQVVRDHYLDLRVYDEGEAFWQIMPPKVGEAKILRIA